MWLVFAVSTQTV